MGKEMSFFEQASSNEYIQLAVLSPGQADAFIKLLIKLTDFTDRIQIKNSRVTELLSDFSIVDIMLNGLTDSNISMDFLIGKKEIRDLKFMKGNSEILILETLTGYQYKITNGKITVTLSKAISKKTKLDVPDLSENNINRIAEDCSTNESSLIKQFNKGFEYVDVFVFDNQIGFFKREDGSNYCLGKDSLFEYEQMKPTYVFRSYKFLPIFSDLTTLGIVEWRKNSRFYCLKTFISLGFKMKLTIYERLKLIGGTLK